MSDNQFVPLSIAEQEMMRKALLKSATPVTGEDGLVERLKQITYGPWEVKKGIPDTVLLISNRDADVILEAASRISALQQQTAEWQKITAKQTPEECAKGIETLHNRWQSAEALAKANQEDAERYRVLRQNTGKEYVVATYGVPHALRITLDANGCEKYLPDGALDFPKTLDAILDDEKKIRGKWIHGPAARGGKP